MNFPVNIKIECNPNEDIDMCAYIVNSQENVKERTLENVKTEVKSL